MIRRAMVLAAGLGTRMRAFNGRIPKPLVKVGGKALIDYVLDRLAEQGVECAVVNVHHLADQIERHLAQRQHPQIVISDERNELLGTGGGVVKALPKLGAEPFFHVNSDTLWIDGVKPNLERLAAAFRPNKMDALLLLARHARAWNYEGLGDFHMDPQGRISRRRAGRVAPFIYSGIQLVAHRLLRDAPQGPFSTNVLWSRAMEEGRLFGLVHTGDWFEVGSPQAVAPTEARLAGG